MLTEKQKKICEKYKAGDKEGLVHCKECPLAIDHYAHTCRFLCTTIDIEENGVEDDY